MIRKGPIVTLAAGATLAVALMVLNLSANATGGAGDPYDPTAGGTTSAEAPPTTAPPTTAAATKPAAAQVTYAGNIGGGAATLAIAVKDGKAIAYVCDGKKAEAWLQGTATNGELILNGAAGASLTGAFGGGRAKGTVTAAGKSWSFDLGIVTKPSGLYRAAADVTGARVVGGWIVLADGTQVGVLTVDGVAQPAPPIDTATGNVQVNGTSVTAVGVDGTSLN